MISLILDVETTGLDAFSDKICEIGLVITDWKIIYGALRSYVNPLIPFDNQYNKLSTPVVKDSPTFRELLSFLYLLLLFADEYVAHNARFDLAFLREELARESLHLPQRAIFDTMRAAGGKKLSEACERYGVHTDDIHWHSALDDAVATFRLAKAMRGEPTSRGRPSAEASLVPNY